jgi:hypothetical protein
MWDAAKAASAASSYMSALTGQGLRLTHFAEPDSTDADPERAHYRRAPWFFVMEWRKD